jgi:hypothetical protein
MKYFVQIKIQILIKLFFWNFFNENENNIFSHFQCPFWTLILESYSPSFHGIQGTITTKVIINIFLKILIFFQRICSLQIIHKKN